MNAPETTATPFGWPVRVYWEDTDAGGIVFYANYLKFMERARTEWLRQLGVQQQALREATGGMFVVTGTQLSYLRPAKLDDHLWITAEVVHAARASLRMRQRVHASHAPDAPVLCEGDIRIGWVNSQTLRPARMPDELLKVLGNG